MLINISPVKKNSFALSAYGMVRNTLNLNKNTTKKETFYEQQNYNNYDSDTDSTQTAKKEYP